MPPAARDQRRPGTPEVREVPRRGRLLAARSGNARPRPIQT